MRLIGSTFEALIEGYIVEMNDKEKEINVIDKICEKSIITGNLEKNKSPQKTNLIQGNIQ